MKCAFSHRYTSLLFLACYSGTEIMKGTKVH